MSSHRHFFSTYEIVEREQHQRASLDIEEDRERWRLHRHHLKWNVTTPPKAPRQLRATQFQSYMTPRYYGDGADTNSSSDMGREPSQQSINHNLSGLTISPKAKKPYVTPCLYPRTTTQVSPTPEAGLTMSPKDIQRSQRGGRRPFAHSTNFLDTTAQETATLSVCNMALGKLVVHRQGDVEPQALVDGHKETCWMSRPAKHQWVYVDLESVQDCTTLRLLFDDRYYATSFRIEVSTNAQDWVCVRDRRNLKAPSNVGNRFWAEINLCNARGRYVRIWPTLTNNEQDCMKLHCLEVMVAVPEPETIYGGSPGSDDDEEEGGVHTIGHLAAKPHHHNNALPRSPTVISTMGGGSTTSSLSTTKLLKAQLQEALSNIVSASDLNSTHADSLEDLLHRLRSYLALQEKANLSPSAEEGTVMVVEKKKEKRSPHNKTIGSSQNDSVMSTPHSMALITTQDKNSGTRQNNSGLNNSGFSSTSASKKYPHTSRLSRQPNAPRNFAVGFEVNDNNDEDDIASSESESDNKSGCSGRSCTDDPLPEELKPKFFSIDLKEVTRPVLPTTGTANTSAQKPVVPVTVPVQRKKHIDTRQLFE